MAGMKRAIGLMSGTSADGVDAAIITTDGEVRQVRLKAELSHEARAELLQVG